MPDNDLERELGLEWVNQERFDGIIERYNLKRYEKPSYIGSLEHVAYLNPKGRLYFFERKLVGMEENEEVFEYKRRFSLNLHQKTYK